MIYVEKMKTLLNGNIKWKWNENLSFFALKFPLQRHVG